MAMIGYARVSTQEQNLMLQRLALEEAGCEPIFYDDGYSALDFERPGFLKALAALKPGDCFVIWKMDRAFRSLRHSLDMYEVFQTGRIELRCLSEPIDTSSSVGLCFYQMRNCFSELEINVIRERTIAGMQAAKKRGAKIGRPRKLSPHQIERARRLIRKPGTIRRIVAGKMGVSERTLMRSIKRFQREGYRYNAG